jgi:hypothetical protein
MPSPTKQHDMYSYRLYVLPGQHHAHEVFQCAQNLLVQVSFGEGCSNVAAQLWKSMRDSAQVVGNMLDIIVCELLANMVVNAEMNWGR